MFHYLLRAQTALLCMLTVGWAVHAQCDDPITFDADLTNTSVQCLSDLPTSCDETVGANRGDVACILGEQRLSANTCEASMALGTGEDGAIVLFDIDGDPNDDRYFIPTAEGLTLVQFENGVAQVSGQVADVNNPDAILNVEIVYDQGTSGADWSGGYKYDMSCVPTTDITDTWSIYILNAELSYLIGEGDLDGTLLEVNHAPSSEYFGFQVGEMANDRNCNYGAGGWFSYHGTLNGVEIQGGQGDVLLDLECTDDLVNPCEENEASVTLIYTAIDTECGDAITEEQVISRSDTELPTFDNAPADEQVACADGLPDVPTVTASDNCEDSDAEGPTVTYDGQTPAYDQICTGSYKVDRTWIAEDCSGNQATHTQTITVVDEVAPVISGGTNALVECDGAGNTDELAAWLAVQGGATAVDDCGTVSWSHDYEDGDMSNLCGETGAVDVIFTSSDDCNNQSSITLTFTIQDTGAPTLTAAPIADVPCETYSAEGIYEASASDVCGDATVVLVSVNEVSSSCAGQFLHVYKAVDDCGNESETYDQVVTLIDETAPVVTISCPANAALVADGSCNADTTPDALGIATFTASDNCDENLDNTLGHSDAIETLCEGSYIITRTWTIESTDHCGQSSQASCDQTITVTDETAPTVDVSAANLTVECDGAGNAEELAAWLASNGGAQASDNCSAVTWSHSDAELSDLCGATGAATVTFTATDDCGNASETTATFTIEDTTNPTIETAATSETVECDGAGNEEELNAWLASHGGAAASDICGGVTFSNNFAGLSDGCGATGSATVTFTATDDCGNASSTTATFTIEDTTAPIWNPYDTYMTAACEDLLDPEDPTLVPLSAEDICGGVSYSIEAYQLSGGCPGTWMRIWTATDECGNASVETEQYVQLFDIIAPVPVITCPADFTVSADENCQADTSPAAAGEATATATDNCDSDVDIIISHTDGEPTSLCDGQYSFIRTWTADAVDDCDNPASTSCEQLITVEDTTAPIIGVAAANLTVECDGAGNSADLEAWLADNGGAEATDNCSAITWSHSDATLSDLCAATGAVNVTFTATDDCGNASQTTATFTIQDTTAPAFSGDVEVSISCDEWACDADALEALGIFSIEEACGTYTLEASCVSFSGGCVTPVGAYQANYTATDECGNTSAFSQIVILSDDVKPVPSITCPAEANLTADADCDADLNPSNTGMAIGSATDNCDAAPEVVVTHIDGPILEGCAGSYSFTRTFTATATDHCGNTDSISCDQLITVSDETAPSAPVIDGPADAEVLLDADCATDASPSVTGEAAATATDNCDASPSIAITYEDSAPTYACVGDDTAEGSYTFLRTWTATATDDCGNVGTASTHVQTITVSDEIAPDFAGSANTFEIACDLYDEAVPYDVMAVDNCDSDVSIVILSNSEVSGSCAGALLRTYEATDDCGNSVQFEQAISLIDTVAPLITLTCPADATLEADAACGADTSITALGNADITAVDNCDADLDVSLTHQDVLTEGCEGSYTIARTFTLTATDHCDNTSTLSCTQNIAVIDFTPPSIDMEASDVTVECDGNLNEAEFLLWLGTNGGASASDNCSDIVWSNDFVITEEGEIIGAVQGCSLFTGSLLVTFTATDGCGNNSSTSATFTIEDTTAPEITAALEVDVPCDEYDADMPYSYEASDSCSNVTTAIDDLFFSGACEGTYQRTYTATDDCGNSSQFIQIINLTDEVPPLFTLSCPADTTLSADAECGADTSIETHGLATFADVIDNCDADVQMTVTHADSTVSPCDGSRVITRTFTITAEDNCGNTLTQTCDQTITVNDDTAPNIVAPADVTVECDGAGNEADLAAFLAGATASDNCSNVTIEHDFDTLSDGCGATGTATVMFTATDACGNSSNASATFTIEDTTAPSIDTAASSLTVECDGMGNVMEYLAWQSTLGGAAASDACSGVSWSHEVLETGDDCGGAVGHSTLEFTATDACGNSSSTTATFTIVDTTAPEVSAANEVEVPCDAYDSDTPYGDYAATDGCSGVTTSIEDLFFSGPCEGSYQRTYTATDSCGNSAEFIQIINLTDEVAPTFTISCPADTTLSADAACEADISAEAHGVAEFADVADNCDNDVEMTVTHEDATASPCDGSTVITRTFTITAEDNCGNVTTLTCDQTITVNDDTAPIITAPADLTVECDGLGNEADLVAFLAGASATDNCSAVTIEHDFSALSDSCGATGSATVSFTATDACGNTSSASATFTIEDTTPPSLTIEGPANQDLIQNGTCDLDTGVDALGNVSFETGDACGSATVEITHSDGDALFTCDGDDDMLEGSYTFIRTFTVTATDECGLQTTESYDQTITVTDDSAPSFTSTGDVENGEVQSVCCESHLGDLTIPEAVQPSYEDNCDSDVAYAMSETLVGAYAPTDAVDLFCLSTTPAAFEDGETCNGYDPHSLRIFALPGGAEFYLASGPGLVANNADGTLTLTQSTMAADGSSAGWDISVTYGAALSWDDWNSQAFPTGYKRDCGDLIDDHENWAYRILESGSLTGTGDYAGSDLSLSHAPSNNYYACQFGLGANNMNNEYGYSGWFTYSGSFLDSDIMGSGDLFGDLDCCLPWSIERDYSIADDCGNANGFAYSIEVNGEECDDADGALVSGGQNGDHTPGILDGLGEVTMGKTPIRVTNLQPNPTNDISQLGFVVDHNMRIRVDLVGMDGVLVAELYDGIAQTGVNHTLDVDAGTLNNGMYQIRLSSSAYLVVKKLLVSE
ncbi:MAG: hypothetical protein CL849_03900 [Crocinitomicaceae bacterium]|nr:hypothetical protein [Crocinitomicaceae bacterium]